MPAPHFDLTATTREHDSSGYVADLTDPNGAPITTVPLRAGGWLGLSDPENFHDNVKALQAAASAAYPGRVGRITWGASLITVWPNPTNHGV